MCALSNRIREEPDWWEKVMDKPTVEKWREEALQREAGQVRWRELTPAMVKSRHLRTIPCSDFGIQINYVLEELHGYASLRDPETGIEVWFALPISCMELTCVGF